VRGEGREVKVAGMANAEKKLRERERGRKGGGKRGREGGREGGVPC
jgi:hypothetical protein